jgi:hypothetical protein
MIWNPDAIDYSKGVDIYDPETDTVYTDEQAKTQPKEIRTRLLLRGRSTGCWVLDLDVLERIKNEKRI